VRSSHVDLLVIDTFLVVLFLGRGAVLVDAGGSRPLLTLIVARESRLKPRTPAGWRAAAYEA
jgi:hypothetical protein